MAFDEEKHRRMELRKATGTRVINPPKTNVKSGADYAMAFVCLNCKTSNKRHFDVAPCDFPKTLLCPVCKDESVNLGRNFKAPRKSNTSQWKKIEFLIEHGFRFHKIRLDINSPSVPYPKTLAEAREFVIKYKEYACK